MAGRDGLAAVTISSHLFDQSDAFGRNSCFCVGKTFIIQLYNDKHNVAKTMRVGPRTQTQYRGQQC